MKVNNCDEVCFDDAIQGPPGKDGAPGPAGKDGVDGKDGETGPAGEDGKNGLDGKTAVNLLPNSTWNLGKGTWTFTIGTGTSFEILEPEEDKPTSYILHANSLATGTQQISNIPHPIYVSAGEVYALAFDFKENQVPDRNSTIFALRVFPEATTSNTQANSLWYENILHSSVIEDTTKPVTEFTRFIYQFTPQKDGWLDPVIYDSDTSGTHESWWREIMVIKGPTSQMPDNWIPYVGDLIGPSGKDGVDGKDGEIKLYDSIGDNTDGAMTQKAVKEALENLVTDIRKTAQSHIPLSYDITDLNTYKILYGWYFVSSSHPSVANAPDGYDGTNYLLELVSGDIGVQTIQRAWSLSGKPPVYRTSTNGTIWSNWKTFLE